MFDPNPKRRLLMKSASSAASGSGQQPVQRPATDSETEPPAEISMEIDDGTKGALPSVKGPNTRRRVAENTFPAEIQPSSPQWQTPLKKVRITSVEQVELGSMMELSVSGHVL